MSLVPSDEQKLLADSVARFLEKEYGFEARRAAAASEDGFSRAMWQRFAELGWLGIGVPEALGGLGGGAVETAIVMEGIGRHLVVEPYFPTVVLGAGLLRLAGAAFAAQLGAVAEGRLRLAFAHSEPRARFALSHVETRAERTGSGFRLTGRKAVVLGAASAGQLVVSARSAGHAREARGITLFLVPRESPGLSLRPYATVDGLRAAEVALEGVTVGPEAVLGAPEEGYALVERVAEEALVALAAEAVGACAALIAMTRE